MCERLGGARQADSKKVRRGLQLVAGMEPENHGYEGIDEIARSDARAQHAREFAGSGPVGHRQSVEREHAERPRIVEGPGLFEAFEGLLEPVEGPERIASNVERLRVARIYGQRPVAGIQNMVVTPERHEGHDAIAESEGVVRFDFDRLVEGRESLVGATEVQQSNAAADVGIGVILLDREYAVKDF